jgi:hypothetical protein
MESSFETLYEKCRTPDSGVLCEVLKSRSKLTEEQADYLAYLAGFTHYLEAAPFLARFGLHLQSAPPYLVDEKRKSIHAKVLLVDMDHFIEQLQVEMVAYREGGTIYTNHIFHREQDGTFIRQLRVKRPDETFWDYQGYLSSLILGLHEEVTQVIRLHRGTSNYRHVYHIAEAALNSAADLRRLLCHVGLIVIAPNDYHGYNVSFQHLQEAVEVHAFLQAAVWFVLETKSIQMAIDFLESIGASYIVKPLIREGYDYVGEAIQYLEERFGG